MRKIKEVLRLKWERRLSNRQIAAACGVSRPTVSEYLRRLAEAGLSWPLPEDLGEAQLEQLLFPPPPDLPAEVRGIPDWHQIHEELKGKYVTLFLLWQEYREANPEGYQYSWFCEHYRAWQGKLDLVMRQDHRAGEKLFVDYAGQTVPVIDRTTGEIHETQIFVAVMGASNYTYAEATWSQKLPDWIGSHIRAFEFLRGVPELVVQNYVARNIIKTIQDARDWVLKFVRWYNTEHRHSALNYVTPQQRHTGEADQILAKRKQVIEAAKATNPQRWSGKIRNLSLPDSVTLNPEKAANC